MDGDDLSNYKLNFVDDFVREYSPNDSFPSQLYSSIMRSIDNDILDKYDSFPLADLDGNIINPELGDLLLSGGSEEIYSFGSQDDVMKYFELSGDDSANYNPSDEE